MNKKPNEGNSPDMENINMEVQNECPLCRNPNSLLTVRKLIEGSLEFYYLVYTVVEDTFVCPKCKNTWTEESNM